MAVYGERDHRFGQIILNLRHSIGLTQARLATYLDVSRRAVGEWEAGNAYPKVEHLKELIALGPKSQAFTAGNEAEEIRVLWKSELSALHLTGETHRVQVSRGQELPRTFLTLGGAWCCSLSANT